MLSPTPDSVYTVWIHKATRTPTKKFSVESRTLAIEKCSMFYESAKAFESAGLLPTGVSIMVMSGEEFDLSRLVYQAGGY